MGRLLAERFRAFQLGIDYVSADVSIRSARFTKCVHWLLRWRKKDSVEIQ